MIEHEPAPVTAGAVALGEWHLVFLNNGYVSRAHRLFCRGPFTHLYACTRIGGNVWLVLDPGFFELRPTLYWPQALRARMERERGQPFIGKKWACLRIDTTLYKRQSAVRFRWPPTCVSFALHLLGVAGFVLTPWQLFRRLLRQPFVRPLTIEELFPNG